MIMYCTESNNALCTEVVAFYILHCPINKCDLMMLLQFGRMNQINVLFYRYNYVETSFLWLFVSNVNILFSAYVLHVQPTHF